jgi:hypothetical protein
VSDKPQILMFYKATAKLKPKDIKKLEAVGYTCIACEDFEAVSFPTAATQIAGFISPQDEMGVVVLRAACKSIGFSDEIGRRVVEIMKKRAGIEPTTR